jgi:hypothetical protein
MRSPVIDSCEPEKISGGVEYVNVAALRRARRSQWLKYSGWMLTAIAQMSDKCVAHVLREREDAIVIGLGTSHSEATVLPIDIAWGQVGDFLHPESEPQKQKQQSSVARVALLLSPTSSKKRANLFLGKVFRQAGLTVARDFWQGTLPALGNSPRPAQIPQNAAQNHQPGSLGVATRQPCELRPYKIHNVGKTKLAPVDTLIWKLKGEEPANYISMQLSR